MDWDGCGGDGWGWGWIFPAVLVGRLIADAFERPARPAPAPERRSGGPVPAHAPGPAAPAPTEMVTCQHCASVANKTFNFCPQCGQKLTPANCRYCGQLLRPEMRFCGQCGGPRK